MSDGIFQAEQAAKLDGEGRIRELRPLEMLRDIGGVSGGQTGVDLGSGTGVFTIPLAQLVGANGRVYAVDNKKVMHDHLRAKHPPANISYLLAGVTATGLPDASVDICMAGFILHEVRQPAGVVTESARILKPGGKLIVMDWRADVYHFGPPVSVRISRAKVREYLDNAGLEFTKYIDWTDNHFVAVGIKPNG